LRIQQIADVMAEADLGVVSQARRLLWQRGIQHEDYGVSCRWACRLVVSSTKIDRYYFDDSVARFFESGNADALAEAMF